MLLSCVRLYLLPFGYDAVFIPVYRFSQKYKCEYRDTYCEKCVKQLEKVMDSAQTTLIKNEDSRDSLNEDSRVSLIKTVDTFLKE